MSLKNAVVVGGAGFGRESLDVLEAMKVHGSDIHLLGVLDDALSDVNIQRLKNRDINFLGRIDDWLASPHTATHFVLGIGRPSVRRLLSQRMINAGLKPLTLVHPTASLGSEVQIGDGTIICAGAVISTNVVLGPYVHVNPNSTIGHDSLLEEFVSINPAAVISGEVHVKADTLVGAKALVLQNLVVGGRAIIGASALVTKNIPDDVIAKGIPATWSKN